MIIKQQLYGQIKLCQQILKMFTHYTQKVIIDSFLQSIIRMLGNFAKALEILDKN
ncbi:unnamed protein product [Paramecium pentaurelia]|uniref:Uncharacterized protein n=1 Tax=Paramecium pentaurelia TaxID=43138 RepID=A0A8S1XMX4_9CILI|nr:unnamed protein product [Paramecium pentaurelia]